VERTETCIVKSVTADSCCTAVLTEVPRSVMYKQCYIKDTSVLSVNKAVRSLRYTSVVAKLMSLQDVFHMLNQWLSVSHLVIFAMLYVHSWFCPISEANGL